MFRDRAYVSIMLNVVRFLALSTEERDSVLTSGKLPQFDDAVIAALQQASWIEAVPTTKEWLAVNGACQLLGSDEKGGVAYFRPSQAGLDAVARDDKDIITKRS